MTGLLCTALKVMSYSL